MSVESKKIFSLKIILRDFLVVESKKVSFLKNNFERSLKDFVLSFKRRMSSGDIVRSLAAKLLSGCEFSLPYLCAICTTLFKPLPSLVFLKVF